ncbi:MAG: hypothetical protein KatS3mg105_3444 [Gemmatales bacterium]|nr:MAG: hypothetical protein KatS3mg105_3444 [Gemmatales bacterium]
MLICRVCFRKMKPYMFLRLLSCWDGLSRWVRLVAQDGEGAGSPVDLSELRDITAIETVPPAPPSHWWLFWAGIGGCLLACVLFWFGKKAIRRYQKKSPSLPPDRWALAELDRLERLQYEPQQISEQLYTLISDVVRQFLEIQLRVQVSRQTTPEFLQTLAEESLLNGQHRELLRNFLERCDLAKFAPVRMTEADWKESLALARQIVEEVSRHQSSSMPAAVCSPDRSWRQTTS